MQIRINRVITIEQAKKLLGDEALSMTDEEIQELIDDFDMIAQYSIKMVQEFRDDKNKQIK
ncbi:hypothetical protein KDA23_03885 [Candidatus Saccharibacteria bacterium]|nr:hypothetical protein [Candidatus Saccharibacteria bacterium]